MIGAKLAQDQKGFTLMELLMVMGLFSLTVAMASDIFLLSNRAQRRVLTVTAAQADVRFALEAMVREVRTGRIDYDRYAATGGIAIPTSHLIVTSAAGAREDFYLETDASVCPIGAASCLAISIDGSPPQSLTSAGVSIPKLLFFISPQQDPFAQASNGTYGANAQPTVTIAIEARTTGTGPQDTLSVNAQTTVASRYYAR